MSRIGMFSYDFYPILGGQGRSFLELSSRLAQRARAGDVLAFSPCRNDLQHHRTIFPAVKHLPGGQLLFSLMLNLGLETLTRREALELVVVNGGPGGILLLRPPSVPLVYVCNHTYRQQVRFLPRQGWKRVLIPLERRSYSVADRRAAISSSTREEIVNHYGAGEVELVGLGVDDEIFQPSERCQEPRSLLFLGRLESRKGIDFLIEAFPLVVAEVPDARLFVAGEGRLRARLEARVRALNLEGNVTFLGFLSEDERARWLARCPIQVVPSVFEGLGLVALEGLASGAAVVATAVPGLTDVIEHGENGCLVEYGDRQGLAATLVCLLRDSAQVQRLRERGLRSVRQRFRWELAVDRLERVLDDALGDRN